MDQENLGRLFIQIDSLLLDWAAGRKEKPFSMTTFFALDFLANHGPTSMKTLATGLDITPASVTTLSHKLEGAGWIARQPNPYDRRSSLLAITAAGREILQGDYESMQSFFDQHLSAAEQQDLRAMLQKIISIHTQSQP